MVATPPTCCIATAGSLLLPVASCHVLLRKLPGVRRERAAPNNVAAPNSRRRDSALPPLGGSVLRRQRKGASRTGRKGKGDEAGHADPSYLLVGRIIGAQNFITRNTIHFHTESGGAGESRPSSAHHHGGGPHAWISINFYALLSVLILGWPPK